jgi:serine protease Do
LIIQRHGQQRTLKVRVDEEKGAAPTEEPAQTALEELHVIVRDLTFLEARQLGLPSTAQGVVVTELFAAAGFQETDLQVGDVIQEVNRQAVRSVEDVRRVLDRTARSSRVLLVNRGGTTAYILVE